MPSYLRGKAQQAGVDRAVSYTLLSRGLQLILAPVSLLLVARFLTPVQQGYYYTFASLLALQIFFELGLSYVVLQFASHEKARLTWTERGTLEGDATAKLRLSSLLRLALTWYGVAACLMVALVLPLGLVFFGRNSSTASGGWQLPWIWLTLTTAGAMLVSPVFAVLEGCGLVAEVARFRAVQIGAAYGVGWLALFLGAGLLASPIMASVGLVVACVWLVVAKRPFLTDMAAFPARASVLNWWNEVWPMQWRIALSWVSGYFIFQLFTPVLFAYQGAVVAGQMGMSLSIATALNTLALAWINTKAPMFGQLIARGEFAALDRLFFRSLRQATIVAVLLAWGVWVGFSLLRYLHIPLGARVLNPLALGLLFAASVVNVVVFALAVYLRAHKKEPFLWISVLSGVLTGLSTYLFGRYFGATGMAAGYLVITLVVGLGGGTWVFVSKRREWHKEQPMARSEL
jgi:hypothetical protein